MKNLVRPEDVVLLDNIHEQERPLQRIRLWPNVTADTISLLTDVGIAKFEQGDHIEAEKNFSRALCVGGDVVASVDDRNVDSGNCSSAVRQPSEHHQLIGTETSSMSMATTSTTSKSCLAANPGEIDMPSFVASDGKPNRIVPKAAAAIPLPPAAHASSTKRASNQICQRHEYNEGMHAYDKPLPLTRKSYQENGLGLIVTSILYYNIGQTYICRSQYQAAFSWFERSLTACQNESSISSCSSSICRKHELEVMILHNLGYCCYRMGRNADGLKHYKKALSMSYEFHLAPNYVAASLNCVGVLHCYQNQIQKAIKMLETSLTTYRSYSGNFASEVATVLNNIGSAFYLCSDHERCLVAYQEALQVRRQVLGQDSIEAAATVFNIGLSYQRVGRLKQAMSSYQEFLAIAQKQLGYESRDVAIVFMRMAEIYTEQRDLGMALSLLEKALHCGRASLGRFHAEVAAILNRLGNLCCETRDLAAGMKYYQEGLEVEQVVLPPSHPRIIITLTNIGHIHKHQGNYRCALETFLQVRSLQKETFGSNSIDMAETMSNIALMEYRLDLFEESFNSYQTALRIRRDCYGNDDHLDIASTLNSVGLVAFKLEMLDLAKACVTRSLQILKKLVGSDSREVAVLVSRRNILDTEGFLK